MIKILAISGSLRKESSNAALLRAVALLAPDGIEVALYRKLGDLPLFNPDLEPSQPAAVQDFRASLAASDAILISSPEYAHGVTGVIKNALDWVVGTGEFVDKPVGLLNPFERSIYASPALAETITVMGGLIVSEASVTIPLPTNKITENDILGHTELTTPLRQAVLALIRAVEAAAKRSDAAG